MSFLISVEPAYLFSVLIVSEIVSVNEVKVDGIVVLVLRSGWHIDFRIEEGVEGVVGRPVGVGDGHVCARPELLLGTAANGSRAVPASALNGVKLKVKQVF